MFKNIVLSAIFTLSLLTGHAFAKDHGHDHAHKAPGMVNINTASAEVMDDKLKFVGERTADRIVKYREANGNFKSIDELDAVKGVGPRIINANRRILTVE